ncbi:ABC transporter permease [Allokutzneria albata]|uniref:ABC-2 type transport system permease protein n=1 Tax=Allokutzneria albata TaxID=211114 RepID=A0A1G9R6U5_ALLAB|nr:ABC-2 family transporter protein [Allokutzneria albata]SDM19019.1 ABC-2 type transport system permease protein [Allokutzneria albata]
MRRYLSLSLLLTGVGLRRILAYRSDFFVGIGAFALRVVMHALLLGVIYQYVSDIAGWTFDEALLLLGVAMLVRGLDHAFTDQLWELGRKLVQRGELVRYLVRPVHPLFSLLSERFCYPEGIGEILAGLAVIFYAAPGLDLDPGLGRIVVFGLLLLVGALVFAAVKLLLAALAFWTTTSLQVMTAVYEVADTARYPLDVFPAPIRVVLTSVIPFALTGFVPADYLLHGAGTLTWLAPVIAGVLTASALLTWSRGVRRFEAVGP